MTSSIEGFKRVFGEFKEIKEGEMELTTRVLAVSDKKPEKRTFKIAIDGSEVWASFWYSSKFGEAPESVVDAIKSIRTGDEVTFDLRQSGDWWNINGVMPVNDVRSDTREPAGQARPVDIGTKQVVSSSYDKCNAMNASVALMVVIFDKHPEMSQEDLFEMHQGFIDRVKLGAEDILDDYHGK